MYLPAKRHLYSEANEITNGIVNNGILTPRPFYAVGHNTNSIEEVINCLAAGGNAIEPDVNVYTNNPDELCISHLEGSDNAPPLRDFLKSLHRVAKQNEQLALVIFDCKKGATTPAFGIKLLEGIRELLTFDVDLNFIISVSNIEEAWMFEGISSTLGARGGLVIDEMDDPVAVYNYFQKAGVINQCYGNGMSLPGITILDPEILPSIERACALRAVQDIPKFIYAWTVNDEALQREFIRIGVDGIFTDEMPSLIKRVHEPEFHSVIRMANRSDNPFTPPNAAYGLAVHTANKSFAGTDANITFTLTGANGSSEVIVNTKLRSRMERNQWNYITLQSRDLGELTSLTVQRDNKGKAPDWYLDKIIVESSLYKTSKTATFNQDINQTSPFTKSLY